MKNRLAVAFATAAVALVLMPLIARPALSKVIGPPDVAWKDMTAKQKRTYMKTVVTPKMKPIFQAFDGKKFAEFNCESCHGKGAADREFKMPSPDIHALPNTPAAFEAKLKSEPTWPKWTKFMAEEVEPPMAKMMGMPVFNPKQPVEGAFGCAKCHRLEGPKP